MPKMYCLSIILMFSALSFGAHAASKTYSWPKVKTESSGTKELNILFTSSTNSDQFCREKGYKRVSDGDGACGNRETPYATRENSKWVTEMTGSGQQVCHMIFKSITCEK